MRSVNLFTRMTQKCRHGTTMVEVIAAGAVLSVLLVVSAQMLSRAAIQQRAISNRRAALQMTANTMERVHALPWDALDRDATDAIASAVLSQKMLRGAQLDVTVDDLDGSLGGKRIRVTATWNEGSDEVERHQELTAWRYADSPKPEAGDLSAIRPLVREVKR